MAASTVQEPMLFPMPPSSSSLRPAASPPRRSSSRPTVDTRAANSLAPPSSSSAQMTPPATPADPTPATALLQTEDSMLLPGGSDDDAAAIGHEDDDDDAAGDEPIFASYLRAFYHFHPTSPVSSVADGSSVTVSINAGDVIFVHSIQPNGWADGTLLSTGARGWLPTNYCEAYDHDIIRNLLNALNNVWDFIRGHEDGGQTDVFAQNDYVRGMIAGVRVFLERAKCLSRDSPLVQSHAGLRRQRKGILGELSSFVKAARLLQEVCHSPIAPEALYDILDDIVLKAFKVVTRAARFLDMWQEEDYMKHAMQPRISINSSTSPMPPTPPADDLTRSSAPEFGTAPKRHSSRLSMGGIPGGVPRPSSTASKRASASHRWSQTTVSKRMSATVRNSSLVSERLCVAQDAFLSSLGAYIGLHMQSRWSMDLLVTTQQSVSACQALLALVDEVWERDNRRSDALVDARDTMHSSLGELVQATRDIFQMCENTDDSGVFMPDQGKRLVDAATLCVRSAGECVTKTRTVIERIGDFEWDPATAAMSLAANPDASGDEVSQDPAAPSAPSSAAAMSLPPPPQTTDEAPMASSAPPVVPDPPTISEQILQRPLPPLPIPSPDADIASAEPSPSYFENDGRDPAMMPAPLRTAASNILRAESAASGDTRSSMDTVVPGSQSARTSMSRRAPSVDVVIPRVASMAISESELGALEGAADQSKPRAGSTGVSTSDTNSTYMTSHRNSEQSIVSRASTRATSPDQTSVKDLPTNASFASLPGSQEGEGSLPEENDDNEEQFLAKTYAHELVFNKDGQVTGGSLPALVERLTTHDSTPDAIFVNTFYLTFRLFTSPNDFAQALVERFESAGDSQDFATPVRLRVYNVFKGWLESHWQADTDGDALRTILHFATGRLKDCLPSASRRLIELTTKVSESQDRSSVKLVSSFGKASLAVAAPAVPDGPLPTPIVTKSQMNLLRHVKDGRASASVLDFDAEELARQITLIESKIFCAIQPEELLASEWMKKTDCKAFNVKAKSALSTDLANLVADSILMLEEPKKRAVMIKQWVKVGKKLLALNNYDSLMAIICSLNSSMVLRLKKTWDCVAAKTLAKLEELKTVVDVSKNMANLRQRLGEVAAPCLPFVGMYLTDLTFVDVGNQTLRTLSTAGVGDCFKVINFDKHVKTARIISDLQRFQIPYKLAPVPELQEWMEMQIHRLRESDQANVQSYYRRSLALEPREQIKLHTSNLIKPAHDANTPMTPVVGRGEGVKDKLDFWNQFHLTSKS